MRILKLCGRKPFNRCEVMTTMILNIMVSPLFGLGWVGLDWACLGMKGLG